MPRAASFLRARESIARLLGSDHHVADELGGTHFYVKGQHLGYLEPSALLAITSLIEAAKLVAITNGPGPARPGQPGNLGEHLPQGVAEDLRDEVKARTGAY